MKLTCICSLMLGLSVGCASVGGKGPKPAANTTDKVVLSYADGLTTAVARDQSALLIPFVGALLSFTTKQLGAWATSAAEKYEVKSKGETSVAMQGIAIAPTSEYLGRIGGDPPKGGGAFLFVRTLVVEANDQGRPLDSSFAPLVLASRDKSGIKASDQLAKNAERATKALEPWSAQSPEWITEGLSRASTLPAGAKSVAVILSMAAVVVVQPAKLDGWKLGMANSSETTIADAMQYVLAGYTYPLQRDHQDSYASAGSASDVKAILTMSLQGPLGPTTGPGAKYDASTAFPLKSNAQRRLKNDQNEPLAGEALLTSWEYAGNKPQPRSFSGLVAVTWPPIFNASAVLLETSDAKKSLETLAKFLGELKISPKDLGIE